MERRMTGIEKIQDKNKSKPSSWILSPFRKQDSSSDDDEVHPTKKMKLAVNDENTSARGKNITRRSKRVKKVPYWKRLEDNKGGAPPQNTPKKNTSPEHGSQNIPLQNQNEPKSTYRLRNANKLAASKGVKEKTDSKREKNNSLILNTPNYRPKITEISPRPQKKSGETRNTPGRRAAAVDTGGSEEVLRQSKSNRNTPGRRAAAADDRNTPGRRATAVDTGGSEVLLQSKSNAKVMQSSFPKDKVTNYIRSCSSLQPVEVDCRIVKEEPLSENPREWTVAQTLSSIIRMDPSIEPDDIRPFREHKIDGSALIQLNFHDIVTYCKIKVGPAIKVSNIIRTLKASTQNPEKL